MSPCLAQMSRENKTELPLSSRSVVVHNVCGCEKEFSRLSLGENAFLLNRESQAIKQAPETPGRGGKTNTLL